MYYEQFHNNRYSYHTQHLNDQAKNVSALEPNSPQALTY